MKIARYRAESHVSAVIGKATPTTEARRIAKIAIIAGIAKIEKPSPAPLKHRGNGVSGGKKIARDRAESHVSAVIGKATPTTEARTIAKIEKPTPTPLKHRGNGVSGGTRILLRIGEGRKMEGVVETQSLKEIKRESVIPV